MHSQRQNGGESCRDKRQRCQVWQEQSIVQVLRGVECVVRKVETGDMGEDGRIGEAVYREGCEIGGRQVETD